MNDDQLDDLGRLADWAENCDLAMASIVRWAFEELHRFRAGEDHVQWQSDRIEALEARNRALEALLREAIDDPHANWRLAWKDAVLGVLDA